MNTDYAREMRAKIAAQRIKIREEKAKLYSLLREYKTVSAMKGKSEDAADLFRRGESLVRESE